MFTELQERIQQRLLRKVDRAESAFVRQHTAKITQHCKHKGRQLSLGIFVCRIGCCGENEFNAAQCWDEKAAACPEFTLKKSVSDLKHQFQSMDEEELRVRWPSVGELMWVKKQIEELIQLGMERINPTQKVG